MDEMMTYNNHYISIDKSGRIVDGWSDGPHPDRSVEGAVCIDDRGGYQFRLFPDGEENPVLYDWNGMIPLYKYEGGAVIERTAEEIEADREALPKPDPVTPAEDTEVWDELDAAYQEGVDSV